MSRRAPRRDNYYRVEMRCINQRLACATCREESSLLGLLVAAHNSQ